MGLVIPVDLDVVHSRKTISIYVFYILKFRAEHFTGDQNWPHHINHREKIPSLSDQTISVTGTPLS